MGASHCGPASTRGRDGAQRKARQRAGSNKVSARNVRFYSLRQSVQEMWVGAEFTKKGVRLLSVSFGKFQGYVDSRAPLVAPVVDFLSQPQDIGISGDGPPLFPRSGRFVVRAAG